MIKIQSAKNDFKKLFERSISEIKWFDVEKEFDYSTNEEIILEHFEILYELEYKYSMLSNKSFNGLPQRKDSILEIIEEKFNEVSKPVIESFMVVFKEWLDNHAILSPKAWSSKRVQDLEEEGLVGDFMGYASILSEYARYATPGLGNREEDSFWHMLKDDILPELKKYPTFEELFQLVVEGEKERRQMDLDEEGLEEFNDIYSYDKKFETIKDARKSINDLTLEDIDIEEYLYEFILQEFISMATDIGEEDLMIEMNMVVFKYWYAYWKKEGIDKARKNVEDLYKQLKGFKRLDVQKRFMIINLAINAVHQTGSMLDYYTDRFYISERDLKDLSNRDTKDWDKELNEIGVAM